MFVCKLYIGFSFIIVIMGIYVIFILCLFLVIISEIRIIVCIILSLIFPLYFVFLGISLLYKDNDPYVVIGIYFHFMFVGFGFYDNIWDYK